MKFCGYSVRSRYRVELDVHSWVCFGSEISGLSISNQHLSTCIALVIPYILNKLDIGMASLGSHFAVVEFGDDLETRSTATAPHCWLKSPRFTQCYWPSKILSSKTLEKMVLSFEDPKDDWELHDIQILAKTDTYGEAVKKMERALQKTDCDSTASDVETLSRPKKRKIVQPLRYDSDDEFDDVRM